MKKILLISILFTLFSISVIAQTSCPTVSVIGPSQQIEIGGSMTFTAKVEGISLENLKYKWDVTAGTITSGQGTSAITIATTKDMAGATITALLEVSGLLEKCPKSFSGAGEIKESLCCRDPQKLDEYGKISWILERKKLDKMAHIFNSEKGTTVLFRISIKEKRYLQILRQKKLQIEKYLIEKHKISKDRIKIVMGGNDTTLTEIYLFPKSNPQLF